MNVLKLTETLISISRFHVVGKID